MDEGGPATQSGTLHLASSTRHTARAIASDALDFDDTEGQPFSVLRSKACSSASADTAMRSPRDVHLGDCLSASKQGQDAIGERGQADHLRSEPISTDTCVQDRCEVWIDPHECDGLPSIEPEHYQRRASALARALSTRLGPPRPEEADQTHIDGSSAPGERSAAATGGPGILAALLALDQTASESASTVTTPANSGSVTPSSPSPTAPDLPSSFSDGNEAAERERFIARRSARRAGKNTFHHTSSMLSTPFRRSRSSASLINELERRVDSSVASPTSAVPPLRSQSHSTLQRYFMSSSPPTSPIRKNFSASSLHKLIYSASHDAGGNAASAAQEEVAEDDEEGADVVLSMATKPKRKQRPNLQLQNIPAPYVTTNTLCSTSPRRESPLRGHSFAKPDADELEDERAWQKEKKRRQKALEKKLRQQVFITMHVAAILARQDFILKLARSFMMFGAPTHRLEAQIQATGRVLDISVQCIYLPGMMLVSFGDAATHTSELKVLKQPSGLDLGKMKEAFAIYNKVIRDKYGVEDASARLNDLLLAPPKYTLAQQMVIGGLASAFIIPSGFYGSFIDCLAAVPLGALLVLVQVAVSRNDLYSSLFEIAMACLNAILAAALARTRQFCFTAVASGSVVLILPGYIMLCASLELANRSLVAGSVRAVYAALYALFLGFGLSMGSEVYLRIAGESIVGAADYQCSALRIDAPWYRAQIAQWWYFLTIPGFLLMLSLRNGQPFYRRETLVMLLVGSGGWACNFFSARVFINRPDITSAIGSFVTGVLGNVWAKSTRHSAFVVMVVGIFVQLPSGLANGGLLRYASETTTGGSDSFSTGLQAASSLVEVAVGLTVGLFCATALVNTVFGGGRRRGAHYSSF